MHVKEDYFQIDVSLPPGQIPTRTSDKADQAMVLNLIDKIEIRAGKRRWPFLTLTPFVWRNLQQQRKFHAVKIPHIPPSLHLSHRTLSIFLIQLLWSLLLSFLQRLCRAFFPCEANKDTEKRKDREKKKGPSCSSDLTGFNSFTAISSLSVARLVDCSFLAAAVCTDSTHVALLFFRDWFLFTRITRKLRRAANLAFTNSRSRHVCSDIGNQRETAEP